MRAAVLTWVILPGLLLARPAVAEPALTVAAPERGCPSRAQVVAALEARLPGLTTSDAVDMPPRRLELERPSRDTALSLRLRGEHGAIELERRLTVDARPTASLEGCEALAEAAGLVVARYLREIGYRAPAGVPEPEPEPPPVPEPPAPELAPLVVAPAPVAPAAAQLTVRAPPPARAASRWPRSSLGLLGVAGEARVGRSSAGSSSRAEGTVGVELHLGWLDAEVAAGTTSATVVSVPTLGVPGELRLRAFPLRVAAGVVLPAPGGAVVPALGLALDVLSFRASGIADARSGVRFEPAVELGTSYLLVGKRFFVRARLAGGLTLGAWDFDARLTQPVFRTPDGYLRTQVEVGLVLWKKGGTGGL